MKERSDQKYRSNPDQKKASRVVPATSRTPQVDNQCSGPTLLYTESLVILLYNMPLERR
jgi:hypothetical protein